ARLRRGYLTSLLGGLSTHRLLLPTPSAGSTPGDGIRWRGRRAEMFAVSIVAPAGEGVSTQAGQTATRSARVCSAPRFPRNFRRRVSCAHFTVADFLSRSISIVAAGASGIVTVNGDRSRLKLSPHSSCLPIAPLWTVTRYLPAGTPAPFGPGTVNV